MASQTLSSLSELTPQELQYLAKTPAGRPPPGIIPNFDDPPTNITPLYAVSSLLLALSIIFASSRVYQKLWIIRKPSIDDLTLLVGFLGAIAYYIACIWGVKYGKFGRHIWDMNVLEAASRDLLITSYLVSVLTPPTMLFLKVTFFIMYLSIFGQWRWMRIAATVGGTITAAFYTAMTACIFSFETPRRHETWEAHQSSRGENLDTVFGPAQSAVGLGIDLYVLILPIIGVSKLQMPFRRKLGLTVIFMSAILAVLGSVLSIVYRSKLLGTQDTTWHATPAFISTLLELQVGIIIACMPAMNQTCRHIYPSYDKIRSTISRYHPTRLFSTSQPKASNPNKDSLFGVIELYDNNGAVSSYPTRKDLYERSMAVPAKTLHSNVHPDNHADAETDTSGLMNSTHWYK